MCAAALLIGSAAAHAQLPGAVLTHAKLSAATGLPAPPAAGSWFGRSVSPVGDLDGNGTLELAVGAVKDGTGGTERGAVWILFTDVDGSVTHQVRIADATGGFTGGAERRRSVRFRPGRRR